MGYLITEFARVPEPESQFRHQSNAMTLIKYLVKEGEEIKGGTVLENWWAVFEVVSNAPGRLVKNLYDWTQGITLNTGSEIALMAYETDEMAEGVPLFSIRVVTVKRTKKVGSQRSPDGMQ